MSGLNRFSAQHNALVYIQEFPNIFFTSKTGGNVTREVTQRHPGDGTSPVNVPGPTNVEQLTLEKPYDAVKDMPLEVWATGWDNGLEAEVTVVVQPVTSEGVPAGKSDQYLGCALVTFAKPDVNRGSAEAKVLSVTLQPRKKL
ncbi:MAG: hypothetical protein ACF8MF_06820 [Phycisphaerales bacterium JB052]